jgi:hypothetical protein
MNAIPEAWFDNPSLSKEKALNIARELVNKKEIDNITEGTYLTQINSKLDKLRKEWDSLDHQGTGFNRQKEIEQEIEKLNKQLEKYGKRLISYK